LPDSIDADRMIMRAVEHGVIYVAGDAFYVSGGGRSTLRLSFSAPAPDRITEGVARLATTVREELTAVSSADAVPSATPARRAVP
jgi:2-aminoadipate transaminase